MVLEQAVLPALQCGDIIIQVLTTPCHAIGVAIHTARTSLAEFGPSDRKASMKKDIQERRQHQRVPARVLIKYGNAEQFFTDYMQNISRGGIFVPTHNPLPKGTRLQVSFSLPYWDDLIETEGIVVHSVQYDDRGKGMQPSGMGIQFQALSEDNLELIDRYVNSLLV